MIHNYTYIHNIIILLGAKAGTITAAIRIFTVKANVKTNE